ncbi:GerW family sporulation protein [Clostridium luticellarii]|jgi:sporulation protein YtfJ|uniref:Putative spore protein YtfJ n=1 Tax=Clostridium luticellarii TaxID=1691940 RepID=A0A2T0BRS0_9CLOT|nr:GerW family sporulation protein [Clostridium luticellarii]MCI1943771.1 GerW family sporulation protein [Clostridium luticellarii]MCI1967032.1 GerW family sporulation protein [Clostridium luticellarii]MCI1994399.1 GerW family sporulation protein [Clostridium luticellarii]MCI2038648.1 GerW family sporulation protein [Clostridium luticellarii]PRR86522.1 putative spore protein YtfJ [Clostridium luticellarii]
MDGHPIENLLKSTMENLKEMIDVNTIVGDAVESKDGSLVIPISKVSFGFASGGSEFNLQHEDMSKPEYPFGGGSGAGVTVKPVAFLVTKGESIRLMSLDQNNACEKVIDSIPQIMDLLRGMICSKNKKDKTSSHHKSADEREKDHSEDSPSYDS